MTSVLLVDDELAIVETLGEILAWSGFDVLSASNGQEGLHELAKKPDVAIVDFMMPVMDGLQMVRAMRADARYRRIPVILMSAAGEETVRSAAGIRGRRRAPWDVFLAKPFTPEDLVAAIRAVARKDVQR